MNLTKLQYLHNLLYSLHISSCLLTNLNMINPATKMGTL